MKKWLWGFGAFLLGLGLYILGREATQARRADDKVAELLSKDVSKNLKAADKQAKKAEAAKVRANEAAEITKKKLEQVRDKNADMGDLLAQFDAERVRQQPG